MAIRLLILALISASVRGQGVFNNFNSFTNVNTGFNNGFIPPGQAGRQQNNGFVPPGQARQNFGAQPSAFQNTGTQGFNFVPGPVGPSFPGQNQQGFITQPLGQFPSIATPSNVIFNQVPGNNGQNAFTLQLVFSFDSVFQDNVRNLARSISQRLRDQDRFFLDIGVDNREPETTTNQHRSAIAPKEEAAEMGNTKRVENAVLEEISNAFNLPEGDVKGQVQDLVSDLVVQSLTTKDDNCRQLHNLTCNPADPYRSVDGSCNNLQRPLWGRALIPLRRFLQPQYQDGNFKPRNMSVTGEPLPSPRLVSRVVHESDAQVADETGISHMVMQWGQFLDHDMTSTPLQTGADGASVTCCEDDVAPRLREEFRLELAKRYRGGGHGKFVLGQYYKILSKCCDEGDICMAISIPQGDRRFPNRTCLGFVRSVQITNAECQPKPVEQMNQITAFLDASQVYGSSLDEMRSVRLLRQGLLNMSNGGLLPADSSPICLRTRRQNFCFLAGDSRVNEQMSLATLHTHGIRLHNSIASSLARFNPRWSDETLFQETRKIVGALFQHITYNHWLPLVIGPSLAASFRLTSRSFQHEESYNSNIDPSIRNVFATAAFRFGHSMVRAFFSRPDDNNRPTSIVPLQNNFGNVSLLQDGGPGFTPLNAYTRGLLQDPSAQCDRFMTPQLTDHLFQDSRGNSLDLAALNIQRGRDHALPPYNAWRQWCRLPTASHFGAGAGGLQDMPADAAQRLSSVYRHPNDIDLFTGGLSERPVQGGLVGPVFACLLGHQFKALKEGDRYWFERSDPITGFSLEKLEAIKRTNLSGILCETGNMGFIQANAFRTPSNSNPMFQCTPNSFIDLTPWAEVPPEPRTLAPPTTNPTPPPPCPRGTTPSGAPGVLAGPLQGQPAGSPALLSSRQKSLGLVSGTQLRVPPLPSLCVSDHAHPVLLPANVRQLELGCPLGGGEGEMWKVGGCG